MLVGTFCVRYQFVSALLRNLARLQITGGFKKVVPLQHRADSRERHKYPAAPQKVPASLYLATLPHSA